MSGVKRYTESCMEGGGVAPDCDGELVDWSAYAACESRLHDVAVACANAEQERDELRAQVEAMRALLVDAHWTVHLPTTEHAIIPRCRCRKCVINRIDAALQEDKA